MTNSHEAIGLERLLGLLEFRADDAAAFRAGLDELTPEDTSVIEHDYAALSANIGRVQERTNPVDGEALAHRVGSDFPLLVALVRVAAQVQAELVRRGVDEGVAWHSLADLGQQVHIHRLVHGVFGFGGRGWVPVNYSGSMLWLGRLQYTLEPDPWSLGVHIPETGPLTPEAVDESLDLARKVAVAAYGEFPIERFTCYSWLLDRGLNAKLHPESNLARFAARFTPFGKAEPGDRDALYFGFHCETPVGGEVDLSTLPQNSSLQRAVVSQLKGGGVTIQPGWFPLHAG